MKYLAFIFVRRRPIREPDLVTIFSGAKVNGGRNRGESHYHGAWKWPKGTFLQKRLAKIREE